MTTGKEFRRRRRRALRAVAMAILACAAFAPSALRADNYQYIVSGWPAANESRAVASSAVALETGTLATRSGEKPLEARFRTSCVSDGHVQPVSAFMLIIR